MDNLDDKNNMHMQVPISVYTVNTEDARSQSNDVDETIKTKLNALRKNDDTKIPDDIDIAKRLSELKNIEFTDNSSKSALPAVDNRTDAEKATDLLKQYLEEEKLKVDDSNAISDIEKRLAALKGFCFF